MKAVVQIITVPYDCIPLDVLEVASEATLNLLPLSRNKNNFKNICCLRNGVVKEMWTGYQRMWYSRTFLKNPKY